MKKIILLSASCFMVMVIKAQLYIDNATFFIQSGATVTVQGDVTSNVDIQGPGLLQLKGSSNQNVNMNGFTIPNLEMDNTANATLLGHARIGSSMLFTNGRIQLGTFNMTIASTATITGHNSSRFFITNNTGNLVRQSLTAAFTYPVGFSTTEYNPVTITNAGTSDDYSVRCLQNVLANGTSGATLTTNFAGNTWVISEAVGGGGNLSLTNEWAVGDELAGFNRLKSGIARFNTGTDWDLPASNVLAAAGAGPYTRSRSSITNSIPSGTPGVFAVGDLDQVNRANLNLKVFLSGPYSGGVMGDGLRTGAVIPLTQPYSSALNAFFTRVGVYDGSATVNETIPNLGVLDVVGTNDDIVDWIYLSLQDGTTPATKLQTRAALVQRDGDIVEYDPVGATYIPVRMPIDADANYHLVVGHRNHLPIRTPVSQLLQDGVTFAYNFTTAQAQAYQDPVVLALPSPNNNNAMRDVSGVFVMWGGNGNSNGTVRASGPLAQNDYLFLISTTLGNDVNLILSPVYHTADYNMNSVTRASGPLAQNDYLFLISTMLGNNVNRIITQHQ
ncbi:MAG: hypothetical protein HOP10_15200 [Chitinophagaceae bacterium]|nr:hypothetical protein [Chitinophagaceae bacterium]